MVKEKVPISFSCKHFGISRSSYYYSIKSKKLISLELKSKLLDLIKEIFLSSKKTYGAPRVYKDLKQKGYKISKNTVTKYMRELDLDARLKRKYRVQTTDSSHSDPIAPRLFKTESDESIPSSPGEVLAGDITYLKLEGRFLYLAIVMDLYNREVVGWSIGSSLETGLIIRAMDMAMNKVGAEARVIFHSDRGSQYASEAYRKILKSYKAKPSMSRKGNCYDNAYVESWFGSFKKEWLYRNSYSTEEELRALVFEYIEVWYNRKRLHSALDYKSPRQYKLDNYAA